MNVIQGILVVVVFVLLLLLCGVAVIWSLNTLFPALAIKYGIFEVLAAIVLTGTVSGLLSRD